MTSGIYAIISPSGKRYVGSAVDIARRWREHLRDLRKCRHHCAPLQNAFNKYGESALQFTILERCAKPQLITREQLHIDAYDWGALYNVATQAVGGAGPHSADTRARIGAAHKGKQVALETRAALSQAALKRFENPVMREQHAKAMQGRKFSDSARRRFSELRTDVARKDNKTGVVGVCYARAHQRWFASASAAGKPVNLGTYTTLIDAVAARLRYLRAPDEFVRPVRKLGRPTTRALGEVS